MNRALTGIKPTGNVHLGNYLGMIVPALDLQQKYAAFYFIADYHALTSVDDPTALRADSRSIAATFLACGLDPARTVLFRQSAIPEVCELAWILGCSMSQGQLERGVAVKAAAAGEIDVNVGTWYYPVLMSADILLYDSAVVPVGKDQRQHVEIARDLAVKMNHRYGDGTLVVPAPSIQEAVAVVPGTDGRKMSKSYGNEIALWSEPKQLRKQVMRIVTDSRGVDDVKDPATCNVFQLFKLFASPAQVDDLRARYLRPGLGYGHAKQELFEVLDAHLAPKRDRYQSYLGNPHQLEEILADGAARARTAAMGTMRRVRDRVGLTPLA